MLTQKEGRSQVLDCTPPTRGVVTKKEGAAYLQMHTVSVGSVPGIKYPGGFPEAGCRPAIRS